MTTLSKPYRPKYLSASDSPISQRLKAAREAAKLTQAEAAALLGVDSQTISRWERGERRIRADDFERAVRVYHDHRSGLGHLVPRGTSVADEPAGRERGARESFAQVLKRRLVLEWLLAFRDEVRGFGADQTEEDAAIDMVTSPPSLRYLTNKALDELSEGELLDAMESLADVVRKRLRAPSGQMKKALAPAPTTSDAKGKGGGPSK